MNIGAPGSIERELIQSRVLRMQQKLHQWAKADESHRFEDLFNLVYDPDFLASAWIRVRGNKGRRTAGVDGIAPVDIKAPEAFLNELQLQLKGRSFRPTQVREKSIPKANGKFRRLGIPTTADRVVQASLALVLEPIFEADFKPCSYGFRPNRRAQDAISEIRFFTTPARNYEWVFEADIKACFDNIDHSALLGRVAMRIKDKQVMWLIRMFLRAGLLAEDGKARETITGTPQGGVLSPLLANIALSALDEHFTAKWNALGTASERAKHQRTGGCITRIVRYADDFVIMVRGQRNDAEALWQETATVLAPMGLTLSPEKTRVTHIDEGIDFLGWHIQRRRWRGRGGKQVIYTYPSKKALTSVTTKVRSLTRRNLHESLRELLYQVNRVLRGWCEYFRYGVSARTFGYLDYFTWHRVFRWIWNRHARIGKKRLVDREMPSWNLMEGGLSLFKPQSVSIIRYRYRGTRIPNPWMELA